MKSIFHAFIAVLLLAIALPTRSASAQDYELAADSRIWIEGVSNRDDWTVFANEVSGHATHSDGSLVPSALQIRVVAAEIKSNRSTIMDRLIHDALNVDEHPSVTYELIGAESAGGSAAMVKTTGGLTLTDTTREIEMDVESQRLDDGSIRFTGSVPLKMSDYGIQPPTAMFGALRTGDDVTVHFDVTFTPGG